LCNRARPANFRALPKQAKRDLASSIVATVEQQPPPHGGRFLVQKSSRWVELTRDEKIVRTLLVLRRPTAATTTNDDNSNPNQPTGFGDADVLSGTGKVRDVRGWEGGLGESPLLKLVCFALLTLDALDSLRIDTLGISIFGNFASIASHCHTGP
jgi:hypothetical protein